MAGSGRIVIGPGDAVRIAVRRPLSMLWSSIGLISGKAAAMGLGFLFWLFAARLFTPGDVGLTAGVISSILLCVQLASLGVGAAFIVRYPRYQRDPSTLLDTSLTLVTMAALMFAGLFLVVASGLFRELDVVGAVPVYTALFLGMSVLGTVVALLDQVSMAQGRGDQILVRNLLNGVVTIALLSVVPLLGSSAGSVELFAFWVGGGASACLWGFVQLARAPGRYRYRLRIRWPLALAGDLVRVGLPNHALTLAERAPGLILPIVVTEALSPEANAYWYTIWMMAWAVHVIPTSVGIALFAEGAHRPESMRSQERRAIRYSLVLGSAAAGVLAVVAGPVLSLLGRSYAAAGTTPLRILVLGALPLSFVHAYFARCRVAGRLREAVCTGIVSGAASVAVTATAGIAHGLTGMAVCWVLSQASTGAWARWRLHVLSCSQRSAPNPRPGDHIEFAEVPSPGAR